MIQPPYNHSFQLWSLRCLSFSLNFLVFSSILIFSKFLQLGSFLLGLHTPVQSWLFQEQLWQRQIQPRAPTSWEVFWTLCWSSDHWAFTSLGVLRSHDAVAWPVIITCSSCHLLAGHSYSGCCFFLWSIPHQFSPLVSVRPSAIYAQCFPKFLYCKQAGMTEYPWIRVADSQHRFCTGFLNKLLKCWGQHTSQNKDFPSLPSFAFLSTVICWLFKIGRKRETKSHLEVVQQPL